MSKKLSQILQKIFWALVGLAILYNCVDKNTRWLKPDYTQPHEYLSVTGYGKNFQSLDGNDHPYSGASLTTYKDNFFEIGSGQCQRYMENISPKDVKLAMSVFNSFVRDQGDYNDIPVYHSKLQCVQFLGRDQDCEDRADVLMKKTNDFEMKILISLQAGMTCNISKDVGKSRIVSLQ